MRNFFWVALAIVSILLIINSVCFLIGRAFAPVYDYRAQTLAFITNNAKFVVSSASDSTPGIVAVAIRTPSYIYIYTTRTAKLDRFFVVDSVFELDQDKNLTINIDGIAEVAKFLSVPTSFGAVASNQNIAESLNSMRAKVRRPRQYVLSSVFIGTASTVGYVGFRLGHQGKFDAAKFPSDFVLNDIVVYQSLFERVTSCAASSVYKQRWRAAVEGDNAFRSFNELTTLSWETWQDSGLQYWPFHRNSEFIRRRIDEKFVDEGSVCSYLITPFRIIRCDDGACSS